VFDALPLRGVEQGPRRGGSRCEERPGEFACPEHQTILGDRVVGRFEHLAPVSLAVEVAVQLVLHLRTIEDELHPRVPAPLLHAVGDLRGVTARTAVALGERHEGARHQVVVVDAGGEVLDQVELHHREGTRPTGIVGLHALLPIEGLGDEDGDGRSLASGSVAREHEIVGGDLGQTVTPVRPERVAESRRGFELGGVERRDEAEDQSAGECRAKHDGSNRRIVGREGSTAEWGCARSPGA
jgi:hypothetical protein